MLSLWSRIDKRSNPANLENKRENTQKSHIHISWFNIQVPNFGIELSRCCCLLKKTVLLDVPSDITRSTAKYEEEVWLTFSAWPSKSLPDLSEHSDILGRTVLQFPVMFCKSLLESDPISTSESSVSKGTLTDSSGRLKEMPDLFLLLTSSECLSKHSTSRDFLTSTSSIWADENGSREVLSLNRRCFNNNIWEKGLFLAECEDRWLLKLSDSPLCIVGEYLSGPFIRFWMSNNAGLCFDKFPDRAFKSSFRISFNSGSCKFSMSMNLICKWSCRRLAAPSPSRSSKFWDNKLSKISSFPFFALIEPASNC